jgi:hypothetical protein
MIVINIIILVSGLAAALNRGKKTRRAVDLMWLHGI